MSNAGISVPTESFSRRAIPLLKEYHEKLTAISAETRRVKDAIRAVTSRGLRGDMTEVFEIRDKFGSLKPAALSLARHVSQRLEHVSLDEMDKLELTLRLAEFEHALLAAEKAVGAAQK
jgi:hypothetical protein